MFYRNRLSSLKQKFLRESNQFQIKVIETASNVGLQILSFLNVCVFPNIISHFLIALLFSWIWVFFKAPCSYHHWDEVIFQCIVILGPIFLHLISSDINLIFKKHYTNRYSYIYNLYQYLYIYIYSYVNFCSKSCELEQYNFWGIFHT